MALSRPFNEDRLALPLSTPFSTRRSMCLVLQILSRQTCVCREGKKTSFVMRKVCLSRQTRVCRDKSFVATNIIFAVTKVLSRQDVFCRDKNDTCGSSHQ